MWARYVVQMGEGKLLTLHVAGLGILENPRVPSGPTALMAGGSPKPKPPK